MIQNADDISILNPSGELDPYEGKMLLEHIGNLIKFRWSKIVLDLGEVDYIHYRILAELLAIAAAITQKSGAIKLANLSPHTRDLLRLAGVESYFETYDSVAEAILSFQDPWAGSCPIQ